MVTDPVTGAAISGTLSVVDMETGDVREVAVGLAPSQLAVEPRRARPVAVANGHSDSISLLDAATLARTDVKIPDLPRRRARQPAHRRSPSRPTARRSTLPAAATTPSPWCARRRGKWKVAGAIPTALVPHALSRVDARWLAARAEYQGRRQHGQQEGHLQLARSTRARWSAFPRPTPPQLSAGTREVRAANSPDVRSRRAASRISHRSASSMCS